MTSRHRAVHRAGLTDTFDDGPDHGLGAGAGDVQSWFGIWESDTNFTSSFDEVLQTEAIKIIKSAIRSPRASAFAETAPSFRDQPPPVW